VAEPLDARERNLALAGVLLPVLLAGLDQTIVATAGPAIQRDLRMSAALYPWITTAYLVASTVMLPIYGKLSDVLGRRPVLLAGLWLFLLGSLGCGFAPTSAALIAARTVQGLGGAALFTSVFVVIADLFPPLERAKWMGLVSATWGISGIVGPLVGGLLTDALGWHWVFLVNLPLGAVALWLIVRHMPALGAPEGPRPRIDVPGALWLVTGVVPFLVALSLRGGAVEGGPLTAGEPPSAAGDAGGLAVPVLFAVAAVGLVGFVRAERRAADPILDFGLFGNRVIAIATAASFVLGSVFLMNVVFVPLYLVNVLGVSATSAGLTLMPLTLGAVTASITAGQLASRIGRYRPIIVAGLAVLLVAYLVMGFLPGEHTRPWVVALTLAVVGLGTGPTLPLYLLAMQNAARPDQLGVVTATSSFSRSLGQVLGVTALGALFAAALARGVAITPAVTLLYRIAAGVVFVALAITLRIPELPLRRHEHAAPMME
jgi:EmrB/QacA subfamily drug resistance transporter